MQHSPSIGLKTQARLSASIMRPSTTSASGHPSSSPTTQRSPFIGSPKTQTRPSALITRPSTTSASGTQVVDTHLWRSPRSEPPRLNRNVWYHYLPSISLLNLNSDLRKLAVNMGQWVSFNTDDCVSIYVHSSFPSYAFLHGRLCSSYLLR